MSADCQISFIIPARNEEALIGDVIDAILTSITRATGITRENLWLPDTGFEIIVADDGSEDATPSIVNRYSQDSGVRRINCTGRSCGSARNAGAFTSRGRILCFVDGDTLVPENAVSRILELHESDGKRLVLFKLVSREPGVRAWLWWTFWGLARHLPLARAKSMPAFMSCTRDHFSRYGPFDESCLIAEEWPLTGSAYRHHPEAFLYDRTIAARTSSRRMELQTFGYARTFIKWTSVVLFPSARVTLNDRIRHNTGRPTVSS